MKIEKFKDIKIAVVIGSDETFSVTVYDGEETDWAICEDCVGHMDDLQSKWIFPDLTRRVIVNARVPMPVLSQVSGVAEKDSPMASNDADL